jgi:hypothetical protein
VLLDALEEGAVGRCARLHAASDDGHQTAAGLKAPQGFHDVLAAHVDAVNAA